MSGVLCLYCLYLVRTDFEQGVTKPIGGQSLVFTTCCLSNWERIICRSPFPALWSSCHVSPVCMFHEKLHLISAIFVIGFSGLCQLLFGAVAYYFTSLREVLDTSGLCLCDRVSEANSCKLRCSSTCQVLCLSD